MRIWRYAGQVGGVGQDGQQRLALVGLGAGQGEAGRQAMRVPPLKPGETSKPPATKKSLVVPVASVSRLTAGGISAALSLADSAIVDRVIRRGTAGLVLCWLRYRSDRFARRAAAAAASR